MYLLISIDGLVVPTGNYNWKAVRIDVPVSKRLLCECIHLTLLAT